MKRRNTAGKNTVKRGRRSHEEKAGGRWRLTIREITVRKGSYQWTSYLVQGFKDAAGKWQRRKFKSRAAAEAFVAVKQLENVAPNTPERAVVTAMSQEQAREAESAFAILADLRGSDQRPVTLVEAAMHYAAHVRGVVNVERVSMKDARIACLKDKDGRGVRERSLYQLDYSLKVFTAWLRMRPRYVAQSIEEDWTPDVCEVSAADVAAYVDSLRSRPGLGASTLTKNNAIMELRNFFNWCMGLRKDKPMPGVSRRWHTKNPAAEVPRFNRLPGSPSILSVEESVALMRYVEAFKEGKLVPYFALALFAGLRAGKFGELRKLSMHPHRETPCREAGGRPLIDLERNVITITAEIAKTSRKRVVTIQPNLRRWLVRYGLKIFPTDHGSGVTAIRKEKALGHNVLRHSFISYHVAAFRSKGDTALQAGNSEAVIDAHYLNLPTQKEGKAFFGILPGAAARKRTPLRHPGGA